MYYRVNVSVFTPTISCTMSTLHELHNHQVAESNETKEGHVDADEDSGMFQVKKQKQEDPHTRSEIELCQAELKAAKAELEAVKAELKSAKAELKAAKAEHKAAKAELEVGKAELEVANANLLVVSEQMTLQK